MNTAVIEKPVPASERVSRFTIADVREMGDWLVWRLKDRFPQVQGAGVMTWLRGQMEGNGSLFIRLGNAVALAQLTYKPLDPVPMVEEVFVMVKGRESDGMLEKDGLAQGAQLYREMQRWGKSIGASEMIVGVFTDVSRETIEETVGKVSVRKVSTVRLGK